MPTNHEKIHTQCIRVQEYPVYIGEHILQNTLHLPPLIKGTQALIITDENVAPYYAHHIQNQLSSWGCNTLILPPGEEQKTLQTFQIIIDYCAAHFYHRDATLIALGGGVINDITGFAAACYHRGIAWIALPTTLLAQVDASVGGKTAVNHPLGKNLIGAFYPPSAVMIDIHTLSSLPDREYRASISEIIKASLIADASFFQWLENNMSLLLARDRNTVLKAIQRSIEIKRDIVTQDEKENSLRMLLNFGHTFAHAIEKACGFGYWLHGEAVAYGIAAAATLSYQMQLLNKIDYDRILHLLESHHFIQPRPMHISTKDLINAMKRDKKIKSDVFRFIVLKKIGQAEIINNITEENIVRALKKISGTFLPIPIANEF